MGRPFTVIAEGSRPRKWASLSRTRPDLGATLVAEVAGAVDRCVESAVEDEISVDTRSYGRAHIAVIPIIGGYGDVHGVHLWVGRGAPRLDARRRLVAAWEWDSLTKLAYHGPELEGGVLGVVLSERRDTRAPTDFFRRVVNFPARSSYYEFVAELSEGQKWSGDITIKSDDGMLRQLQMFACTYRENGSRAVRGVVHDVTDLKTPASDLETTVLRAFANAGHDAVGLLALDYATVYEWLAPPVGPLARWVENVPDVHADDLDNWVNACKCVADEADSVRIRVRVRFSDSNWIEVDALISGVSVHSSTLGLIRVLDYIQL